MQKTSSVDSSNAPSKTSPSSSPLNPQMATVESSATAMQTPPFLTKLYQLVDDPSTTNLVSWTEDSGLSFTVHKPSDFGRDVLPKYFKHNNFSSFVRQLNQYGFHKQNPDRWMFGHENFRKNRPDLLKNITRRRPKQNTPPPVSHAVVSSHAIAQNRAVVELGNYGIENEVKALKRDKDLLIKELVVTRQAEEKLKARCDALENRVQTIEHSTKQMQAFIMHYFSQVLQPYSHAVASRKRKRLPPSSTHGETMDIVSDAKQPDVAHIAPVSSPPPQPSVDALRVMMQQMGMDISRPPAPARPRPPPQPRAIENAPEELRRITFDPETIHELPEHHSDENTNGLHGGSATTVIGTMEPDAPETVSLDLFGNIDVTPSSSLVLEELDSALKESNQRPNGTMPFLSPNLMLLDKNGTAGVAASPTTNGNGIPNGQHADGEMNGVVDDVLDLDDDESTIEHFLDYEEPPLPPPLTHLPAGTDIQALAQRIDSFSG